MIEFLVFAAHAQHFKFTVIWTLQVPMQPLSDIRGLLPVAQQLFPAAIFLRSFFVFKFVVGTPTMKESSEEVEYKRAGAGLWGHTAAEPRR